MAALHDVAGLVTLAVAGLFALAGMVAAAVDRGHRLLRAASWMVVAAFVTQLLIGLGVMVGGGAPAEALHLLYAAGLVIVLPLGLSFAAEALPRARSGVLAGAGVAAVLLAWRLLATG